MNEKKYSIVGKVEIGTDEYRDLIETNAELKSKCDEQNSKYWDLYHRANKLDEELKDAKKKIEEFQGFVDSSEEIKAKYRLYLVEKQMDMKEDQQ